MADDPNAAWGWIPDSWRNAGAGAFGAPDQLGAPVPPPVDDGLAGAPGGQLAPAPAPPAAPIAPDQPPPAIAPFDSELAGGPPAAQPAPDAFASPLGAVPPPISNEIAGAPGAPQLDPNLAALAPPQQPAAAPPLAVHASPPIAMPVVPPGPQQFSPQFADPQSKAAWDTVEDSEINRLSNLSPEQFAAEQAKHEEAKRNDIATQTLKASQENLAKQTQDWTTYQTAAAAAQKQTDQVNADAQALAKKHVSSDPRSTFSKIRGVLSAFVNGLVAPYNGGRNIGLEAIQKEIEQDTAANQEELQNQWKAIGMRKDAAAGQVARAGDAYRAAETHRLSLWQATINDLQTKQTQYDPRGTTAMNIAGAIRGARAQQAEIASRLYEQNLKSNIEVIKASREQQEQALKIEQFKQQKIKDAADIQVAKQNANTSSYTAQTGRLSQQATAANAKDELALKVQQLKSTGDEKGAEKLQKFGIVGVTPDDPSQGPVVLAGNATDTEMGPLRDDVAATRSIVNDIDQIMAIRHGGSTKVGNSAEHQQLKALGGDLLFKLKEANKLKQISDTDMKIFDDEKGFDDPTKFRSFRDGILQFRQNTIDSANAKLAAHGVHGKIDIPLLPPSVLSDSEKSTAFAGENPAPIPFATSILGMQGLKSQINDAQVATVQNKVNEYEVATTPHERELVIKQLTELSQTAASEAVRDQALSTLQRLQGADVGSSLPSETATPGGRH